MTRRDTGILGEQLGRDFLKKRGYRIIETNYRCPEGEMDIIARHGDFLVFVEVRSKKSLDFGSPEESITLTKSRKLKNVAAHYLQAHDNPPALWRIDVIAIEFDRSDKATRIELYENAISQD